MLFNLDSTHLIRFDQIQYCIASITLALAKASNMMNVMVSSASNTTVKHHDHDHVHYS